MRKARQRYWFWLSPEDPLAQTLDDLGPKERNQWIVEILRAGLLPGGYRDLVESVSRLGQSGILSPAVDHEPAFVDSPAVAELMSDAMSQLFPEDEDED